jgi:uncharacterized LabA/DUF88 family protein
VIKLIKVAIIIDGPNLLGATTELGKNINFKIWLKHITHIVKNRRLVIKKVFHDVIPHHPQRNGFHHLMEEIGFEIISVPLKCYGPRSQKSHKSRTDQSITVAVMEHLFQNDFDHLILLSGDSDYEALLECCQERGKTFEIWATSNSLAHELVSLAKRHHRDIFLFDSDKFKYFLLPRHN